MSDNVYARLALARKKLKAAGLKQSGNNRFAGYTYFELGDFLPKITELEAECGILSLVSFDEESATLTVVNTDKPEESIVFTSPMSTANLKGCHEVQNLGAAETYLRRYLYNIAYEIVESDALDGTQEKSQNSRAGSSKPKSEPKEKASVAEGIEPVQTDMTYTRGARVAVSTRKGEQKMKELGVSGWRHILLHREDFSEEQIGAAYACLLHAQAEYGE